MEKNIYDGYIQVLQEELVTALGCTEPIAIAYAAAVAEEYLGCEPEKLVARCSGNIIKNVKGVTVPNSGGQKGVEVAAIPGAIGGDAERLLEVLTPITEEQIERSRKLVADGMCEVELAEGVSNLYISLATATAGEDSVLVEIVDKHTHIAHIVKNGKDLLGSEVTLEGDTRNSKRAFMSVRGILDFAEELDVNDVKELLDHQVACNLAIAEEGLTNPYGANVGKNLMKMSSAGSMETRAAAYAAAGSDARMSGCDLAVVTNSGSGNQGITVSMPVLQFARGLNVSDDKLYRALAISNLMAAHLKSGIGLLSAFCGAVSAATGSGAAITYLQGGTREQIELTISNTLGNVSGIVCDGAKPSCAAKIASAVDAAVLASKMALNGDFFRGGEGILTDDIEQTIRNVGRLGRQGMHHTDTEILNMMIGK